jgi:hypothetical protein
MMGVLLVPARLFADVSTTPGTWDLYRDSTLLRRFATEQQCVTAADDLNVPRTYTCRTQTTVVVTADTQAPPPAPEPAPLPPPSTGSLAHGDTYVVQGSNFGTKNGLHVYDNCTSSSRPWDKMRPNAAASEYNLQCRNVGYRGVPGPHPNATRYMAGAFQGTGANSGQSVDVQERFSGGGYVIFAGYHRYDPRWNFSGQDNNKLFGLSGGVDMYASPYMYVQYESGGFSSASRLPWLNAYDPNGGSYMRPQGPLWSSSRDVANITQAWVYREVVVKLGQNGFVRVKSNGQTIMNQNASIGGSSGMAGFGGYSGQRSTNNFSYFADVYFDAGPNPGRIYLCSGSICELQPYTSWANDRITIRVAKGRLPSGTATVRFVSEATGNRDLGTVTLR